MTYMENRFKNKMNGTVLCIQFRVLAPFVWEVVELSRVRHISGAILSCSFTFSTGPDTPLDTRI